jgi:hypothetical protein
VWIGGKMLSSLLRGKGRASKAGEEQLVGREEGGDDDEEEEEEYGEEEVEQGAVGRFSDPRDDPIERYQRELSQKEEEIEAMKLQLRDKDDRIAFLQALLHRSHLSETYQDIIRTPTRHYKDLDSYLLNAVSYSQTLEEKIILLKQKNKKLRKKLKQQESEPVVSREAEIKLLRQILSVEEQIDNSQEDEIEYLQSLARRQYEYATAATTAGSTKKSRKSERRRLDEEGEEWEGEEQEEDDGSKKDGTTGKGGRGFSHSSILDEVRSMLDNFGV